MDRIDFYNWEDMWTAGGSPVVSVTSILDYKYSGKAVSDIFFNQVDTEYFDIVLDLSSIEAYIYPLTSTYTNIPYLWRLGVKLYRNGSLIFTGLILTDGIVIDETRHKFKFTADSIYGIIKYAAGFDSQDIVPSYWYDMNPTNDYIDTLYNNALDRIFRGFINKPQLSGYGHPINYPVQTTYALTNYSNDFDNWSSGDNQLTHDDLFWEFCSIGWYPPVSGTGENELTIFMLKGWRQYSGNLWHQSMKIRAYTIDIFNPLFPVQVCNGEFRGTQGTYVLEGVLRDYLPNYEQWFLVPQSLAYSIPPNETVNFGISYSSGRWEYDGYALINQFAFNPDVTEIDNLVTLENILYLKQAVLVNTPTGDFIVTTRPPIIDTLTETVISNAIINNPIKSGVSFKKVDMESKYSFIANNGNIASYITYYEREIRTKFNTKLAIDFDGIIDDVLSIKFMYKNNAYFVTKLLPDNLKYTTEIEAYGTA